MADTAMSQPGSVTGGTDDSALGRAVWRLRSRGCWDDAAALLAPGAEKDAYLAVERTHLLVERAMFTGDGWSPAEDALRSAESLASDNEERGAAACERGNLAYATTVFRGRDRSDEARVALGRAAALLPPASRLRPRLDFRRGLVAQHITRNAAAAHAAFKRAHEAAAAQGDSLLCSFTWRHLAGLAAAEGEWAEAKKGFTESLRIREDLGYLVGIAPALASLADVEDEEPEAHRLRSEARRLVRLLGGVPRWLADQLAQPAFNQAPTASD
ncbi:hypothetical protein [Streptomyces boninensis]|uniref:hypothetical protein n=1 Tax=Streptomyces boninensis TaxID=2039455 RepID=UPI003B225DE7